ncbi:MAG TPA: dihydrofolate reductase [Candidatus Saccharimonadales bacterium]|nr:dihydrofolate reductase [Candidatus Saccharimonadales bacterium]
MKTSIVGFAKNMVIGKDQDMPWGHGIKDDLRHFKETTTGHAIIMGSKTYESMGRALPNRQNIVISRKPFAAEGATVVDSLEKAYAAVDPDRETFVIGGGQIYKLAMDTIDRIIATEVQGEFDGDIFFPVIDPSIWKETSREHHNADERNNYAYDFVIYDRIRS